MTEEQSNLIAALQASRPSDDDLEGAVVIGYAAVVEWMTPSGKRWLSLETGDASGEGLQRWQVQGYLANVLHDPAWHYDSDDDGEEEGGE